MVKEHLAMADGLLSKISASGDGLMLLAAARQEIRAAFEELPKDEEKEGDDGKSCNW